MIPAPDVIAAPSAQALTPQITEVGPGVFRVRAGEPARIVPSIARRPARLDALGRMPKVSTPPVQGIKVWRMAPGCRIELPLGAGEVIYGLGLQCKHLEQNGWRRTLYAASGDDNGAGMGHAPVPLYVSTAGYAVLVDTARSATFSVGEARLLAHTSTLESGGNQKIVTDVAKLYGPERQNGTLVYVDVPSARGVDIYLFAGPRMGDAIARYNLYSGGGCLPSLSGLGPHYIFGAMLDASSVLPMSDHFKRENIPFTTVALEPGWQTHAYSSSYLWNSSKFPPDFGREMRRRGYDLYLWCQMYLDGSSPLIPLLGDRFGDFGVWHGLVPDMADPRVREIYGGFLTDQFIRKGVAGSKLDEVDGSPKTSSAYQSWMFPDFTSFPSGADGDQMRNLLGRLGVQASADAFRRANRRTFGMARASQAWAAPLPVAIYSDEYDFGDYVRYSLSAGVQGLLWAPEVRDAANEREWAQKVGAAAFSAKMVYNGWQFPHLIWEQPDLGANERNQLLSDDNPFLRLTRRFNDLRMALLPYLYTVTLEQANREVAIPFLTSSRGYGVLWDHAAHTDVSVGAGESQTVPSSQLFTEVGQPGGLTARSYNGHDLGTLVTTRIDPQVDFNWTEPPAKGLGRDYFSVRWTGSVMAQEAGDYTFVTTSDDGVRLWVDDKQIVDDWSNHAARDDSATVHFGAHSRHKIRMEYFQDTRDAIARLAWRHGQPRQVRQSPLSAYAVHLLTILAGDGPRRNHHARACYGLPVRYNSQGEPG